MLTASPITRQTVGRTFTIAISALGAGAILQVGVIGWAFATRWNEPSGALAMAGVNSAATPAGAHTGALPRPAATPDAVAGSLALATAPAPTIPPKPTPVQQKAPPAVPANRFEEIILQGRQLRDRGDTSTAITKFREAGAMDPRNPAPIAELAATYEKIGFGEKAGEQWRRIYEMGDAAGVYFSLADAKLKASQALALREASKQMPEAAIEGNVEGIATGATLGLLAVSMKDEPDDLSVKKFTLHVPIKARPATRVEVKDLIIHVLFYDLVDGQNVVQTSANVNSRWVTPPADWSDADTEELAVEYQLPKPAAKAAKREDRKFFGYIVRIYYKQQLQAATAEPARLAQQYPPPPTLPKDPDK